MSTPDLPGDPWRYATWEGAEIAELLRGRQMSLADKLAWLEEMTIVVERLAPKSAQPENQQASFQEDGNL